MIIHAAEQEIRRYWSFLSARRIWSPYPIRSYCLAGASHRGNELLARYFLFPVERPTVQNQAVAQLVCKFIPNGESVTVDLLVDALRENELTSENVSDIRSALQGGSGANNVSAETLYERAMDAVDSGRYDDAIRELDKCLCFNPAPLLAMEAYYNLSATIWGKFRFNERRGADISDDEFRWVQGCNLCLRRALKIYESLPRQKQLEAGPIQLHQAIKGSLSPTISYGSIVYRHGERQFRSVRGLPPLKCLTEIKMEVD